MITHPIPPEAFFPHGNVTLRTNNGNLHMTTNIAINTLFMKSDTPIKAYACLPGQYKLPFRIDMTVRIDSPALYLLVGKGHIGFGTGIMDNRPITDILGYDKKPSKVSFDNNIPIDENVELSVTYGKKAMWITINDELRCVSKTGYIKAKEIPEAFHDGFGVAIACDKRTQLTVQSFAITEYESEEPDAPAQAYEKMLHPPTLSQSAKPTLEECIHGLSPALQKEVLRTDEYLLKDMKKALKCKRKIEGGYPCSRITYVSPWGFRYKIQISDAYVHHDINWISYNTKREQEKYGGYKKADYTEETLKQLASESPEFADEMFFRIKECVVCTGGSPCPNKSIYEHNEKKKRGCGWGDGIQFKMLPSEFEDLRKVVDAIHAVLIRLNIVG